MLVYADRSETVEPRRFCNELRKRSDRARKLAPGLQRDSCLIELLIDAGRLLQGIADVDFAAVGDDRPTIETEALNEFLMSLAQAVLKSADPPPFPELQLPSEYLSLREPEGYAFYAVYPEAYAEAARRLRLHGAPCIIGIRSIGTSLAAMVAAALGARRFATVRPFGDPFAHQISISQQLEQRLLERRRHYVIVDEGPGRSGSSFAAIADWLIERGIPLERIAFIPSHGGEPGPEASEEHRHLWRRVQRSPASFDTAWLERRFGPLARYETGATLKFHGMHEGCPVLLKFAGLGSVGRQKFAMARALYAAGWTAEPLQLAHGFLVERWHGDAQPLTIGDRPLKELAQYIAERAKLFPASADEGASLEQLFEMLHRNTDLAFGPGEAAGLDRWRPRLGSLAKRSSPVRTDNRMDARKWLRLADGRLLKGDALDHHCAHDLVGAQDSGWDVAGAAVEFDLDAREAAWLAAETGRAADRLVDAELIEFMAVAYCAFRLGQAQLAGDLQATAVYRRRLGERLPQQTQPCGGRKPALDGDPERTAAGTIKR